MKQDRDIYSMSREELIALIEVMRGNSSPTGQLTESPAKISGRKTAEEQLRESEERYRNFSSLTTDYVYACKRRGNDPYRVSWMAGAVEKITGYTQEEIFAFGCWMKIVYPDDLNMIYDGLLRLKAGDTHSAEFRIIRKDGTIRWIQEVCSCKNGDSEGELNLYGTSCDITQRKHHEHDIQVLNENLEYLVKIRTEELEKANSELSGFCYAVSHELRAPIARLQGFSMALEEEFPGKGKIPFIAERIGSASRQLQNVVDSILMLSRLSRAELKLEDVNISEIAQKVADRLISDSAERDVVFIVNPEMTDRADRNLMEACLGNLIENAFKYSSQTDFARIEVGREKQGTLFVYFVKDNGAGFDMEYAGKLFTPFERLHQENEFPGIGIGLATVQKIIDRHGGRLWAEGSVGKGATFYFTVQS